MFAQLILTVGKARTFNQHLPPAFLGAFDAEKIAFVPYEKVSPLFYQNDFNWNVAPSDHGTKEFSEIKSLVNNVLETGKHLYYFGKDDKELRFFIQNNLSKGTEDNKPQTAVNNRTYEKYRSEIGKVGNELFAQFLCRIYREIPDCKIANFSTLKNYKE